jgi:hypothetical protein
MGVSVDGFIADREGVFEWGLLASRYPVVVGGGTPFLPPGHRRRPARPDRDQDVRSRVIYERCGRAPRAIGGGRSWDT